MTDATTAKDAVHVLSTIRSELRQRPVWSARELRNQVIRIAEAHGMRRNAIAIACSIDDSTVTKAFTAAGTIKGIPQFDWVAIALGFTPCGDLECRTYKSASIDRVAA